MIQKNVSGSNISMREFVSHVVLAFVDIFKSFTDLYQNVQYIFDINSRLQFMRLPL